MKKFGFPLVSSILSIFLLVTLSFSRGWADTHSENSEIGASHDTLIDPNNPSTTYNGTRLEVTYSNFPGFAPTRRTLLQFDLADESSTLSGASLVVHVVENNLPSGASVGLGLYKLVDGWTEATVTYATRPSAGDLLQTINITSSFTGTVRFDAPPVGSYSEEQRTGDHTASFLLLLENGSGSLGFAGSLLFEDREGDHDGVNGDEPIILFSNGQSGTNQTYLPLIQQ